MCRAGMIWPTPFFLEKQKKKSIFNEVEKKTEFLVDRDKGGKGEGEKERERKRKREGEIERKREKP